MTITLENVYKNYRFWGRHFRWYKFVCFITLLGQEGKLRKLVVEKLELNQGDTVLDLACGTGLNFKYLEAEIGSNGFIIAVDYTNEMLSVAKERAKQANWTNIDFILADAAQLGIDSNLDGVLSTLGISAIPDHQEALKKAINLLKDRKIISILDAQLPSGFLGFITAPIAFVYRKWASWDYTKNIADDLKKLIPDLKTERFNLGIIFISFGAKNSNND